MEGTASSGPWRIGIPAPLVTPKPPERGLARARIRGRNSSKPPSGSTEG